MSTEKIKALTFINDSADKSKRKLVVFSIACLLTTVFGLEESSLVSESLKPSRNQELLPYLGILVILWLKYEFMSKFLDYNSAIDSLIRSQSFKVNGHVLSLSVYLKSLSPAIKSRYHAEYFVAAQAQTIEALSKHDPSNNKEVAISQHTEVMLNTASHYTAEAQIISERKASVYFIEYTFPMLLGWAGIASMCYMAFW